MTNKHDVFSQLRREICRDPTLFGGFLRNDTEAGIEIGSVHHLVKQVNGETLVRPEWYYDVSVQGNGLVDITSHMVDQSMWLLEDRGVDWDCTSRVYNTHTQTTNSYRCVQTIETSICKAQARGIHLFH